MSATVAPAPNPTVHFATVDFVDADERGIAAEIWLDDLCRAPWAAKETMKIAAFLSKLAADASTAPLYLKDIESRYNIQQGEITMSLNMMTTFRVLEGFDSDRGQIVVRLRLGLLQAIRLREMHERFVGLAARPTAVEALASAAAAMREADAA